MELEDAVQLSEDKCSRLEVIYYFFKLYFLIF